MEKHLWGYFVPKNARHLLLGSFSAKPEKNYDWFYGTRRNQFWPIMEAVYKVKPVTVKEKQDLFTRLGIAVTDCLAASGRKKNDNADTSLANYRFNTKVIKNILRGNNIVTIYFSSKFAEKLFEKMKFKSKTIKLVTLPSPSPRYARLSLAEKIERYKQLMPKQ